MRRLILIAGISLLFQIVAIGVIYAPSGLTLRDMAGVAAAFSL